MKQEQFNFNTGSYHISENTCSVAVSTDIQTALFGSQNSLSMTEYCYFIKAAAEGENGDYLASACQLTSNGNCFTLDNLNNKGSTGTLSW